MSEEALHHLILFYDIQGSAGLTNPEKLVARRVLQDCCTGALESASIPADRVSVKDLGDGAMVLFTAEVPKSQVLGAWLSEFHALLQRAYERSTRPFQVRLAVHSGELHPSLNEHTGTALDFTARLVDAPVAKRLLASTPSASLAVIVSDVVYDQVVRHGGGGLAPTSFSPITVQVKETDTSAWLHLPGWTRVPMPPDAEGADRPGRSSGSPGTSGKTNSADSPGPDVLKDGVSVSGGVVGVIGTSTVHGPFTVGGSPDGAK
ncbi:adenylate/guanylate cyclase domain-containing protein [Catenulispora pinisilvae]|uniref:adenylate/guanylate cyclase domain-containing protein n=1 Tax=Catenulispora pinisilvae TaxID=2705253 RepID=UPI001890D1FB|nr:adenylate/guanylate cyclase domain-containing protein [Catenulispora pinisilvae]